MRASVLPLGRLPESRLRTAGASSAFALCFPRVHVLPSWLNSGQFSQGAVGAVAQSWVYTIAHATGPDLIQQFHVFHLLSGNGIPTLQKNGSVQLYLSCTPGRGSVLCVRAMMPSFLQGGKRAVDGVRCGHGAGPRLTGT